MLSTVLEAKEKQLAKKSKRRLRWFSAKPLYSFISVTPELSEDAPLWGRVEMNWTNVWLLGLKPEQLQEELQRYWAKPSWRQWFQRLFTSINQQLEIWFYYQQCLALREIKQSEPEINFDLSVAVRFTDSQSIMEKLSGWLIEDELKFEKYLSRCSARWLTKHFESALREHETRREKQFLKKLKKELKALQTTEDIAEIEKEVQAAYQQTERIMWEYCSMWYQYTYSTPPQSPVPVEETRVVVAGSSATASPAQIAPAHSIVANREDSGFSSRNPDMWIKAKRKQIENFLEKKDQESAQQITHFLEQSLNELIIDFIEPQLQRSRDTVTEVLLGKIEHQAAMQTITQIQSRLIRFYRQGALLFHPDKHSSKEWDSEVMPRCSEFFQDIHNMWRVAWLS